MNLPQYPQQQEEQLHIDASNNTPPLWAPHYGAPITVAVKRFFKKYATFSGRASRSEYWWWTLVSSVVTLGLPVGAGLFPGDIDGVIGTLVSTVLALWFVAIIVPTVALTVRRLHDSNNSGWLYLFGLVPFVGGITVLVFLLLSPDPAGQRYDRPDY